ncbi:hypothetical protein A2U01_0032338, partial [Trifolium medium]|nr:hypothetical protein [Trifolium medium]
MNTKPRLISLSTTTKSNNELWPLNLAMALDHLVFDMEANLTAVVAEEFYIMKSTVRIMEKRCMKQKQ